MAVVILFAIIIGIAMYFFYAYKKQTALTEEEEKTLKDYEKVLTKAHKRARQVVRDASKKAQSLLAQTSDFDKTALTDLTQKLQEETTSLLSSYHTALTQAVSGENQTLVLAASEMEKMTEKELEAYSQQLTQTLVVSQDKINQEVAQDLEKAKQEIEQYKNGQMEKARAEITDLVQKIAFAVLGKALSMEDHEKLIIASLEEAKKEGLLGA